MAAYRFYAPADAAQDKIWRDTVDVWGEMQAETYIRGLHAHLQRLCDNHLLWRRLPQRLAVPGDLKSEAYFSRYEHHYLFFRELDNGDLGVMSILHERMDMAVRLREDLTALDARGIIQTD
ncbi:type II toxin-antitoxin system RelE/ParE family toxin [Agrobacterium tumefaciens]|uniref:type II toxin-antitoxin system RelE/ParE family toxin n=1 Tax=Agrobacterium TaxID=357 RepID=UPI001573A07E|nr:MULTISPECIES: type II toxin-antitoxin system RelE/ParE family toxin [Agrobacterium]MBO0128864.1 type II toxin-antitoxin system RelE/ParE family toxin [Agrobacterium sp. OT33]NTE57981.1 type II toxin-antitoxin system RelE/ParE family toxin [Agrobacterium tumefaciens]NTE57984.1 type II toxin-antitoxin system RelE/ParE family toxin [Agrobacterium tumefaciens]NTE74784.1 type II toxin-antitoxin system RelE/ParE family toxin [Agrobacterium tumefaciens]NTE74787.1 type II toxin-antitoxin system Rel